MVYPSLFRTPKIICELVATTMATTMATTTAPTSNNKLSTNKNKNKNRLYRLKKENFKLLSNQTLNRKMECYLAIYILAKQNVICFFVLFLYSKEFRLLCCEIHLYLFLAFELVCSKSDGGLCTRLVPCVIIFDGCENVLGTNYAIYTHNVPFIPKKQQLAYFSNRIRTPIEHHPYIQWSLNNRPKQLFTIISFEMRIA